MGFKIWLLILNMIAFMSSLAYSTAEDGKSRDIWVIAIGSATVISIFSIICSWLPAAS